MAKTAPPRTLDARFRVRGLVFHPPGNDRPPRFEEVHVIQRLGHGWFQLRAISDGRIFNFDARHNATYLLPPMGESNRQLIVSAWQAMVSASERVIQAVDEKLAAEEQFRAQQMTDVTERVRNALRRQRAAVVGEARAASRPARSRRTRGIRLRD